MTNDILTIRCQECKKLDNGCAGKTNGDIIAGHTQGQVDITKWACSRFEFNPALLEDDCGSPEESKQIMPEQIPTGKESKHDAFLRLSQKRVNAVLEKIRILENLADNYTRQDGSRRWVYDFTKEDADRIINNLQNSVNSLKKLFDK